MPSKARLLAKSMIESPILSEITTNPTVTPTTITTAVNDVATGNFASIDLLPSTGNDVGDQAFVQSTNRLYIWSGSGWYNIALINTTPTWDSGGQPAGAYELSADSPQTATTITLAASDPEGFSITYNYVTGGSMDSMATITQDSSVFTITPKTLAQLNSETGPHTGTITFRATDGINILPQVSSFTLNFITTVENSRYTTLLASVASNSPYSLPSANNQVSSFSVNSQTSSPTEVVFGDSGTKMFVLSSDRYVYSYNLSTAYDASTASYVATSSELTELSTDTSQSFRFKPDGTVMFVSSSGGYVYQYSLSTAWDVSTISYASKSARHGNSTHSYTALTFKPDGTRMYMAGLRYVMSMTLSSPWDLGSTTSDNTGTGFTNAYLNLGWVYGHTITGMDFNSTGTSLTMVYGNNASDKYIIEHPIDDAWNVSNATVLGSAPSTTYQQNSIQGLAYANDGNTLVTVLDTGDTVYTYDTGMSGINNNITDTSTNNHSITVNGDAYAGTFSPYRSGGYSTYFDGNGDNLDISASSDFDFGTGDFTFEMSFYAYTTSGGGKYLITNRASGFGAGVFQFVISAAATNAYCTFYGYDLGGYSIVPETWYHISAVKSGDTITLYLNGTTPTASGGYSQSHSGVNNVSMGSSSKAVDIGSNGTADYFKGYITDLRIVKGTAITPPAGGPIERLEAVTNTSLLTCHLPYISDGSTNDHSITVNGNTSTKPFSPYDYTEYSAADHGGSVYHEGNAGYSDYLETNYTAIGTNNFTLQFWVYPKTTSDIYAGYFSSKKSTSIPGINVAKDTIDIGTNSSSIAAFGNPSIKEESWSHIAVVRSGDISTAYVNGKSLGSISGTGSFDISSDVFRTMQRYGYNQGSGWPGKGYISDLKLSQTVDYTGEFDPPTTPLSSTNAEFHIKGTDASIIDKSQGGNLELDGNVTGSTTQVKFAGSKSMYFPGSLGD